jgi:hypothetical protein
MLPLSPSVYKASPRRNVGRNMAREAEAVSPLTGRKSGNYCLAHVQWSATSQITAESDNINDIIYTNESR